MALYRLNVDDEASAFLEIKEADSLPELRKLFERVRSELTACGRDAWIEAVVVNPDGTETIIEDLYAKTAGRPKGSVKTVGIKNAHDITVTDEAWLYAKAQGNASSFIESLILAHKGTA